MKKNVTKEKRSEHVQNVIDICDNEIKKEVKRSLFVLLLTGVASGILYLGMKSRS